MIHLADHDDTPFRVKGCLFEIDWVDSNQILFQNLQK